MTLTKKYSIEYIQDSIEKSIVKEIAKETVRQKKTKDRKTVNPRIGSPGIDLFSLILLGAQFGLDSVKSGVVEFFSHVLYDSNLKHIMDNPNGRTGHQLVELIERLKCEGWNDDWARDLAFKIIGGISLDGDRRYFWQSS